MTRGPRYESKVIKHTVSPLGNDIITWELTFPKWLVAEFNTHKVEIERNSASSRAVPTNIIVDMVRESPVLPMRWKYNSKGMSPQELMRLVDAIEANQIWLEARDAMIPYVRRLQAINADKQRVNRLLEPWMWTIVVCTMTGGGGIGINNFFGLRDTKEAQPEFQYIAQQMHKQYHASIPTLSKWHLPYVTGTTEHKDEQAEEELNQQLAIISSARCGRVTHYRQGQEYTLDEDIARGKSFAEYGHFSPLRHASRAGENKWYGNMYGWESISKIIMKDGKDYATKCCDYSGLFGFTPESKPEPEPESKSESKSISTTTSN